jgi:HlyD family secretion protein
MPRKRHNSFMTADTRQRELQSLRIERSQRSGGGEPPRWASRYIVSGITLIALLSVAALAYRWLAPEAAEVQVVRAAAGGDEGLPGITLTASGYIVAHHRINVNSKVTGRVAWIGVEKGDKVKQGQVLVRLEDEEFRAQVEAARGAVENARAYLQQLENGSRPEEIRQAQHTLDEARATLADDRITLERTDELVAKGVSARQALDDARARFDADKQRVGALEQAFRLAQAGPRPEEIARAKGALMQAEGQLAFAQSQLQATVIRAPISGTILERTAEKGELITAQFASAAAGGPVGSVVSLADLTDLQVELDIAQDDFAKLAAKQKGIVTTDAYPDRKYEGVIAEISPEANRQKATVQIKVQIFHPDHNLRPEMNATVRFLSDETKKAGESPRGVFVPTAAVHDRGGQKIVFIAFRGEAAAREVSIRAIRSNGYVVEGLNGGEDIIVVGPASLKDGDRIKIKGLS